MKGTKNKEDEQEIKNRKTTTATNTTTTTTKKHTENDHDDDHDDCNDHGHSHNTGTKKPMSGKRKVISFLLLFLIVPVIYSVPFILKKAGETVASNRILLVYIWAVYLVIMSIMVYLKKHLLSLSSFVNQNLIWLIFTLGVFIVLDIPKMIQQVELRTEVLYVWCTLTMIPNLIIFFFDDTDYKTQERIEEEKEERKKKKDIERKQRLDEKRKAKLDEKMKKYTPTQRKLINGAIYLFLLFLVLILAWQTYRWYLRTQRNIQERLKAKTATSEYMHEYFDIEN